MWPQYVIIAALVLRWVLQVARDLEKPTAREQFIGAVFSTTVNGATLWLLHMGGFFKGM